MTRCTYPQCNCPFDAPPDPAWCARGFPKDYVPPEVAGLKFTRYRNNPEPSRWMCEGDDMAAFGYTPNDAQAEWGDRKTARDRVWTAVARIKAQDRS